jgi:phage tail sheath protein FI
MPEYLVPGVFVEELAQLPPAVAEVDSALPAFVGYTAQAKRSKTGDLRRVAQRIRSLAEFEAFTARRRPASFIGSISTSTAFSVGQHGNCLLPVRRLAPVLCQWRRRLLHRVGRRLQRQRPGER